MTYLRPAFAAAAVLAAAGTASAQDYPAVPLLKSGETVLGEPLAYPTTGPAVVTAAIVTIAPGGRTVLHRHGVPLFVYVLEGAVTVDYGERGTRRFEAGQSFMEAMDVAHAGTNPDAVPVRMLAVYMGAEGADDVVPVR